VETESGRHVDGQVTEDLHAARRGMAAQRAPLLIEAPLRARQLRKLRREALPRGDERLRIAAPERFGPVPPRRAALLGAQRLEQRVVIQPATARGAEGAKSSRFPDQARGRR
jgi:hypothetical protein